MGKTNDKADALAAHLETALNQVRSGVSVETSYRRATETGRNRGDQKDVLGDPVYYVEVLPATQDTVDRDPSGTFRRTRHEMQVVFMYEYTDGESQGAFNDLKDAALDAVADGWLQTDAGPQTMEASEATDAFTALDSRNALIAHETTFTVTLTDQH